MPVKSLLSSTMKKWLQKSIESEFHASQLYKHIANQLQRLGYFGSQKFYLAESADELTHYQKIVDFMNDMGDVATIPDVKGIDDEIKDIEDALNVSYQTELDLFEQYKEFYEKAEDEDVAVAQFLLQFIEIQRLAVGEYGDLISKYDVAKETKEILFFDKSMGKL